MHINYLTKAFLFYYLIFSFFHVNMPGNKQLLKKIPIITDLVLPNIFYVNLKGFISSNLLYHNFPVTTPISYYLPPSQPILVSRPFINIENNFFAKKWLGIFEKQKLALPFVIESFPVKGISGSYTLPPKYRALLLANDFDITNKIAVNFNYYCSIIYGGTPISSVNDILIRIKQLFKAVNVENIEFPLLQSFLSADMLYLQISHQDLDLPDNFIVTPSLKMTPQKYLETISLRATHGSIKDHNIVFGDRSDTLFKTIIENNRIPIQTIIKQPSPDALFMPTNMPSPLIIGQRGACVLDVKICHPAETVLPMLSSYSSITPQHQVLKNAEKMEGQLLNQAHKITDTTLKTMYLTFYQSLKEITTNFKKVLLKDPNANVSAFKIEFEFWLNSFLSKQLQALDSLATGMCFLPSKIAEIVIPEENTFEKLQKTNPQLLQQMTADIRLSKPLLISLFPEMKDYPRYDPYKVQYEIMTILQKYQMLENYYTVRKLLLIEDLQLPQ